MVEKGVEQQKQLGAKTEVESEYRVKAELLQMAALNVKQVL